MGNMMRGLASIRLPLGTLSALAISLSSLAIAGEVDVQRSYTIAPQPLESALLEFSEQSALQLVAGASALDGLSSSGIDEFTTAEAALDKLLRNTGLDYDRIGNTLLVTSATAFDSGGVLNPASEQLLMAQNQVSPARSQADTVRQEGADAESTSGSTTNPIEEIVVTGSQIRGSQVTDILPVTVMSADSIAATGASSGEDLFRGLAGAGSVSFGANSTRAITGGVNAARGDVSSINLRSLGTGNTLVLINGRRMVNHPSVQTDPPGEVPVTSVNMNSIPVLSLERVEVLRDGASAMYGTDAVAGVINNILKSDYEGLELSARYGAPESSSSSDLSLNLHGGVTFNDERTNISFDTTYFQRDPLLTGDREFSRSSDLRPLVVGTEFEGDVQFRNLGSDTPWGRFLLPNPVTIGGVTSTIFHIQPNTLPGCLAPVPGGPPDICIDDGNIDEVLHFDSNHPDVGRTIISEVERLNHYMTFNHSFDTGIEMYGEAGWFFADSRFVRGTGNSPLDTQPIWIPGENYWNPFGALTLSNGTPNPNRIPGLDINEVPAEGLVIPLNGATDYRILDGDIAEIRLVEVEDRSWRLVTGFRGELLGTGWDFDSAIVYSEATSLDRTNNRISNSAFQEAAALNTPDAYNFFNGAGAVDTVGDGTPNPTSVMNKLYVVNDKDNRTTLALVDFKMSKPDVFSIFENSIGLGVGVEFRRERYEDDRDPRLDGTILYTDYFGDSSAGSDTMGTSPSPDTYGERKVWSAFAELAVPVVNEGMSVPLVQSLEFQLAARYENFSDVGDVMKPRIAMGWYLIPDLQIRASYSEGFRAPNLAQANEGISRRVRYGTDWYYCQAQVNKGDVPNMNACDGDLGVGNNIDFAVERVSFGSNELVPEESENLAYGIVWTPSFVEGLTITADYWDITQENLVGLLDAPNHLAYDWALRINGMGGSPYVVRNEPTPEEIAFFDGSGLDPVGRAIQAIDQYLNFDYRETSGADFGIHYRTGETRFGAFDIDINASKLFDKEQINSGPLALVKAQGESAVQIIGGGKLMKRDRDPHLRAAGSVRWYRDNWDASLTSNYVGEVHDTSVTNDVTGEWWEVDSWLVFGARVGYAVNDGMLEGTRFTLGVRNLLDEDPPLADDNFGFLPELHDPYGRFWYVSAKYEFSP